MAVPLLSASKLPMRASRQGMNRSTLYRVRVRRRLEPQRQRSPYHVVAKREHAARFGTLAGRSAGEALAASNPRNLALHRDALIAARKIGDRERREWTVAPEVAAAGERCRSRSEQRDGRHAREPREVRNTGIRAHERRRALQQVP